VILSEDVITKGSTIKKMREIVESGWGAVVGVTCIGNRYWEDTFEWIPLISCYTPPKFSLYYDDNTPENERWDYPRLPDWEKVAEKPKNELFNWV
jgi:orotate phosphoribosyltransferase